MDNRIDDDDVVAWKYKCRKLLTSVQGFLSDYLRIIKSHKQKKIQQ